MCIVENKKEGKKKELRKKRREEGMKRGKERRIIIPIPLNILVEKLSSLFVVVM